MKVKDLIKIMNELPEDTDICVLWWTKETFDFQEDDDLVLTNAGWEKVCDEFDNFDDAGNDLGEWISDAVMEHAGFLIEGLKS
jgi:hypothetical protein